MMSQPANSTAISTAACPPDPGGPPGAAEGQRPARPGSAREFAGRGSSWSTWSPGPGRARRSCWRGRWVLKERGRRVAAIVGDLATDNDARRLAASGAPARQIITGTVCHLEAQMVRTALEGWDLAELDYLFIENVGNLVCPASFDLGEHLRVLLFPVTEGEDKPLKYPTLINTADVTLISKIDLAEAVGFDRATARRNLEDARPGAVVLEVSARATWGSRPGSTCWKREEGCK